MKSVTNTITTLRPDGKRGVTMDKIRYKLLAEYLVNYLASENNVTFVQVLENARVTLPIPWDEHTALDLLQVKLDLEARGCLYMRAPRYDRKLQFLELIQRNQYRLREITKDTAQ